MGKTTLIVGKEAPAGNVFAEVAMKHQRSVVLSVGQEEKESDEQQNLPSTSWNIVPWNRTSSLSARSFIVKGEHLLTDITEFIVIFDANWYLSDFNTLNPTTCSRASDSMITSYFFMVSEIISHIKKQGHGSVIFLFKSLPTVDLATKKEGEEKNRILVSASAAAFRGLAESVALEYASQEYSKVLLAKADSGIDDTRFATWLFEALDSPNTHGAKIDSRNGPQWLKLSNKPSSGFSFFKR